MILVSQKKNKDKSKLSKICMSSFSNTGTAGGESDFVSFRILLTEIPCSKNLSRAGRPKKKKCKVVNVTKKTPFAR